MTPPLRLMHMMKRLPHWGRTLVVVSVVTALASSTAARADEGGVAAVPNWFGEARPVQFMFPK